MSHSSGSHNYYHTKRTDTSLPPLKDFLGDVYYNTGTSGRSSVNSHPPRSQTPSQSSRHHNGSSYGGTESSSNRRTPSHSSSHNPYSPQTNSAHSHGRQETEPSGYEFGVYKIAAGHLVQERSSTVDRFPSNVQRTDDPRRQYVCDICKERFDRPIALETHSIVHTPDIRPFKCTVGNCNKSFNVQSNQRRHEKTHFAETQFETVVEDNHRSGSSRSSSSSQTSAFSAKPSYYSSSRR